MASHFQAIYSKKLFEYAAGKLKRFELLINVDPMFNVWTN